MDSLDKLGSPDVWAYERSLWSQGRERIAGLDEAGRGPLAGPVVAAAVVLPRGFDEAGIGDSKAMTPAARDRAFDRILSEAQVGIGVVGPDMIDDLNILRATHRAMKAALQDLGAAVDFILVDGLQVPDLGAPSLPIVKGDSKSVSIGAASIVAKVTRDRIMLSIDQEYPQYGFAAHKGYCTKDHLKALDRWGPCVHHRKSFAPVAERIPGCRLPGLG